MGKYHICVYAICKNEEDCVKRWMDSMREADEVYVLDTGSTDRSVALLQKEGAIVRQAEISPWRFDKARKESMDLLPEDCDICVCTDLDEVLHPGWRAALEQAWQPDTLRARYRYTWNFNPDGSEGVVFYTDKIHARRGFRWVHPVHEVLQYEGGDHPILTIPGIQLDHHARAKASRAQYLPLLELAVREDPDDDRNSHYLGREYMFHGQYRSAIATLEKHLALPRARWRDERCASMRYIARCYENLNEPDHALPWYLKAIAEAPWLREPWCDAAQFFYRREDWYAMVFCCEKALSIRQRPDTYITESAAWSELPDDLAAVGYYRTGNYAKAREAIDRALAKKPDSQRLRENRAWIEKSLRQTP